MIFSAECADNTSALTHDIGGGNFDTDFCYNLIFLVNRLFLFMLEDEDDTFTSDNSFNQC